MATKIKTWYSKESTGILEQRTYESGQVRWYEKGFETWYRLEEDTALRWLEKKYYLTEAEKEEFQQDESYRMLRSYWLHLAQKVGSNK